MKIDLCKIFGVEEGEEFKFRKETSIKYRIYNYELECTHISDENDWSTSYLNINDINGAKIIKLPKKKQFTDDELSILRNIDTKYKWLARDEYREILYVYKEKPEKTEDRNWYSEGWCRIGIYNHLFKCIQWRDEEPVFIDDYVERGVE